MKRVTTYELTQDERMKARALASDRSRGFDTDRIVDRAHRVADSFGYDLSVDQANAILAAINDEDRNSSCGLDRGYENDRVVSGVLAAMRTEVAVTVRPFVREYKQETVRTVKLLLKGSIK